MASYNKFQSGIEALLEGINAGSDTWKLMLVNSPAPVNTNSIKSNLTEISAGNGYSAGGASVTITTATQASGTYTLAGNQVVWTASGGTIGPFQYAVFYDDTVASPVKPLVAWWDYGSSITLQDGETFTVTFGGSNPGTIFTNV
jgi:hypothetical protein